MKQLSNPIARVVFQPGSRSAAHAALGVALFVTSALGCSESAEPNPSFPQAGSAGQTSGGGGGTGGSNPSVAGSSGSGVGGTAAGSGTGGGSGGSAAGSGGSAAGSGGMMGGSAGAGGTTAGSGGGGGSGGGAGGSGGGGGSGGAGEGWIPLFNGTDLDGWTPRGNNAASLFKAADGMIHVYPTQADQSDQPEANLVHEMELGGKYTLHVEYKWGEARFGARKQSDRDAGILFHISGDATKVWPDSVECQIGSSPVSGEWTTGDLWVIGGPVTAQIKTAGGQLQNVMKNGNFGSRDASEQAELAHGQWNVVEVIVNGADEAIYMVNGKEVNRVFNMKYSGQPLSKGHVSVQAEYAELFYRNIRYKVNQ